MARCFARSIEVVHVLPPPVVLTLFDMSARAVADVLPCRPWVLCPVRLVVFCRRSLKRRVVWLVSRRVLVMGVLIEHNFAFNSSMQLLGSRVRTQMAFVVKLQVNDAHST